MAGESIVQVTEGVGKKLHTWQRTIGVNNVEDEIVVLGEPVVPTYVVAIASNVTLNNAASTQLIQLMAGASLNVYVREIVLYQVVLAAAAGLQVLDVLRVTSAPTGGTAVGGNQLDTTDAAPGATAAFLPTVAGTTGARVEVGTLNVLAAAPTSGIAPSLRWSWELTRGKSLRIPAGATNGIVIRNVTGAVTAALMGHVIFQEYAV